MPIVVTVELPATNFVLGRVLKDVDEYHVELTQFVPIGDQLIPYFWIESDAMRAIEPTLQDHPHVASVTKFDERAGRTLCQIEWKRPRDEFLTVLMESDLLVSDAHGRPKRWEFELLASDHDDLTKFHSACRERNISITVRQMFQSGPSSIDRLGVTEKQSEILQLAYERGYFGIPRESTVTELAAELNISPQAASKRLRRGLENVVGYVLDNTD